MKEQRTMKISITRSVPNQTNMVIPVPDDMDGKALQDYIKETALKGLEESVVWREDFSCTEGLTVRVPGRIDIPVIRLSPDPEGLGYDVKSYLEMVANKEMDAEEFLRRTANMAQFHGFEVDPRLIAEETHFAGSPADVESKIAPANDDLHTAGLYFAEATKDSAKTFHMLMENGLYNGACDNLRKRLSCSIKGIYVAQGKKLALPDTTNLFRLIEKMPFTNTSKEEELRIQRLLQRATKLDQMGVPSSVTPMTRSDAMEAWVMFTNTQDLLSDWAKRLGVSIKDQQEEVKFAGDENASAPESAPESVPATKTDAKTGEPSW